MSCVDPTQKPYTQNRKRKIKIKKYIETHHVSQPIRHGRDGVVAAGQVAPGGVRDGGREPGHRVHRTEK